MHAAPKPGYLEGPTGEKSSTRVAFWFILIKTAVVNLFIVGVALTSIHPDDYGVIIAFFSAYNSTWLGMALFFKGLKNREETKVTIANNATSAAQALPKKDG